MEAEQEFDAWSKVVSAHPAYIRRERRRRAEWEKENFSVCQAALWELRPMVPSNIDNTSLSAVMEHPPLQREGQGPNVALAERIWRRRVLWLLRATPAEVANLHAADLAGPYNAHGLDLLELRAIYAVLPQQFVNDKDGRKAAWREEVRERLVALTEKEAQGKLTAAEARHPAYDAASGPSEESAAAAVGAEGEWSESAGELRIDGKPVMFEPARFGSKTAALTVRPNALFRQIKVVRKRCREQTRWGGRRRCGRWW